MTVEKAFACVAIAILLLMAAVLALHNRVYKLEQEVKRLQAEDIVDCIGNPDCDDRKLDLILPPVVNPRGIRT